MSTIMTTIVSASSYTVRDYIFFILNLAIIAGYMTLVVTMALPGKILPVLCYVFSRRSRWAVAAFFFIASLTRAELAWKSIQESQIANCPNAIVYSTKIVCLIDVSTSVIVLHIVQVVAVWLMLFFVGIDLLTKFSIVEEEVNDLHGS